ncbi:DUF3618 domain-containing protein [Gordonia sputi]
MTDNHDRPEPDSQASAAEVEADIARTREELGQTVDALTDKLNVKAQARSKTRQVTNRAGQQVHAARARGAHAFAQLADRATDDQGQLKPAIPAAAAALAVTVIAVALWRRRAS